MVSKVQVDRALPINVFLAPIIVAAVSGTVQAQQPTLREMVRQKNGPITKVVGTDFAPTTLASVLARTDLVVQGIVTGKSEGYLSDDDNDVLTDYSLGNVQVIFPAKAAAVPKPGLQVFPMLTVTQPGGTAIVIDQTIAVKHSDHPLAPGMRVVLFLRRDANHFRIVGDYLGVFTIENDRVYPLSDNGAFEPERRGQLMEAFVADILKQVP